MTKEDLEPLIDNLKNDYQKMTLKELEQKYNTPYWIISKLFKKYNIKDVKRENKLKKHIVERINKEYTNKHGEHYKIIEYNNSINVVVEFENGLRKTVQYQNAIRGHVNGTNYNDRLGEENYNNSGEKMKIVEYINSNNIIVEFENGFRKQTSYKNFLDGTILNNSIYINRIGQENVNKYGEKFKIVEYNNTDNITVEFEDGSKKKTTYKNFKKGSVRNDNVYNRCGIEKYNNQGCLMKIVEYINSNNISVEFQDKYKYKVKKATWQNFKKGNIKNPYYKSVFGVGMVGHKYVAKNNGKTLKEYNAWIHMLQRCYDLKYKEIKSTYDGCFVCDEWLLYENFYEWLHSQENFDKWLNNKLWAVDKDILVKGNKIYSPETCCLVPPNVNSLFIKSDAKRGNLPIGVWYCNNTNRYKSIIIYGKTNNNKSKRISLGYPTPEEAFYLGYKPYKEAYIQQIAQEEYDKGNITKQCYKAMMKYEVEITD